MLKQGFSQKMNQKLSPQQIQLMKLFLVPTSIIDERIKEEIEENPALEETEDDTNEVFDIEDDSDAKNDEPQEEFELDDYINEYIEDDPSSYKLRGEVNIDEEDKTIPITVEESFHEYLMKQINMMEFEEENDFLIAQQVVGSLDEDGYLRRALYAIKDDLLFTQNIDVEEKKIQNIIYKVQSIEPIGIGAKDLRECLLLQINAILLKGELKDDDLYSNELAKLILEDHFDQFSKKHYEKLKRELSITNDELRNGVHKILALNPKPASAFTSRSSVMQYVVPDFFVINNNGVLELSLNNKNIPDLRINDQYLGFIQNFKDNKKKTKSDKDAMLFVKKKIDGAKWFIDAIKQRYDTLYRTMYNIMDFQQDYFLSGDEADVKPMILKDIAVLTSLDISTISRVASSKFVQTEFGTKRLKDFFSESIETTDGSEVSTVKVKHVLKSIIAEEDKLSPYSDEKLKELLLVKGYNMARRTIAKYREQLNIPVARLRKEI